MILESRAKEIESMRANVLLKIMTAVGVVALLMVVGSTAAVAQTACEQACHDQFDADVQQCDDDLMQKLSDLAADEADCVAQAPTSNNGAKGCFNSVNKRRRNAQKQHSQCLRHADNQLRVCLDDCAASPTGGD